MYGAFDSSLGKFIGMSAVIGIAIGAAGGAVIGGIAGAINKSNDVVGDVAKGTIIGGIGGGVAGTGIYGKSIYKEAEPLISHFYDNYIEYLAGRNFYGKENDALNMIYNPFLKQTTNSFEKDALDVATNIAARMLNQQGGI